MILSESINLKLQNQVISHNSTNTIALATFKSKVVSAIFMTTGLASGTSAVIVLLNRLNIL